MTCTREMLADTEYASPALLVSVMIRLPFVSNSCRTKACGQLLSMMCSCSCVSDLRAWRWAVRKRNLPGPARKVKSLSAQSAEQSSDTTRYDPNIL